MTGTNQGDIAIAHDQITTNGGAERVCYELARTFDAPIYAMRVDDGIAPDDVEVHCIADRIGKWCMRRHHLVEDIYQMMAWQHVPELYEYDTVIQNKTNPYWFVPRDTQTVVRYCHSTPRNLYDQFHRRGEGYLTSLLMTPQRMLYQQVLPYADAWAVNSDVVSNRCRKYFGLEDVDVIYPPVDVAQYSPDDAETTDYLFSVGRLAHHKRLDLIVETAEYLDCRVVIAGRGPERDRLEEKAPSNVEFLGYISEEEKQRRLSGAKATLMLSEQEDFGIVPIESMAAGTPVIGVREGFTRHQILEGKNGLLCPSNPGVTDLYRAIGELYAKGVEWDADEIEAYADQFGVQRFRDEMRDVVERAQETATVETKVSVPELEREAIATDGGHHG